MRVDVSRLFRAVEADCNRLRLFRIQNGTFTRQQCVSLFSFEAWFLDRITAWKVAALATAESLVPIWNATRARYCTDDEVLTDAYGYFVYVNAEGPIIHILKRMDVWTRGEAEWRVVRQLWVSVYVDAVTPLHYTVHWKPIPPLQTLARTPTTPRAVRAARRPRWTSSANSGAVIRSIE